MSGAAANPAITNVQEVGVDEGDIVKQVGRFLLVLQDGRIFSVDTRPGGRPGLALADRTNVYRKADDDAWYDEMLVYGDRVVITGYSYDQEASQISVLRVNPATGRLSREGTFFLSFERLLRHRELCDAARRRPAAHLHAIRARSRRPLFLAPAAPLAAGRPASARAAGVRRALDLPADRRSRRAYDPHGLDVPARAARGGARPRLRFDRLRRPAQRRALRHAAGGLFVGERRRRLGQPGAPLRERGTAAADRSRSRLHLPDRAGRRRAQRRRRARRAGRPDVAGRNRRQFPRALALAAGRAAARARTRCSPSRPSR